LKFDTHLTRRGLADWPFYNFPFTALFADLSDLLVCGSPINSFLSLRWRLSTVAFARYSSFQIRITILLSLRPSGNRACPQPQMNRGCNSRAG
jgi:hypothetical protein